MTIPASPGRLQNDFLTLVGSRIRDRRKLASQTVQELADRAGISRRLLTQIEHGQANPSLVTVTGIARALGVDFTDLLDEGPAESPVTVVGAAHHRLVWHSPGGSAAYLLVATSGQRTADLWHWRLAPDESYSGRPDPTGSQELFAVLSGTLTLVAEGADQRVHQGESARLLSDRAYAYRNDTDEVVTFVRVVALAPPSGRAVT